MNYLSFSKFKEIVNEWAIPELQSHLSSSINLYILVFTDFSIECPGLIVASQKLNLNGLFLSSSNSKLLNLVEKEINSSVSYKVLSFPKDIKMDSNLYSRKNIHCTELCNNKKKVHMIKEKFTKKEELKLPSGCFVLLSSGSTGNPKLIIRKWTSALLEAKQALKTFGFKRKTMKDSKTFYNDGCLVSSTSICHTYNFNTVLMAYYGSLQLILCWNPQVLFCANVQQLLKRIQLKKGITILFGTPPFYESIVCLTNSHQNYQWNIDFHLSAGSFLCPSLALSFSLKFYGKHLHQDYGTSETGTISSCSPLFHCCCSDVKFLSLQNNKFGFIGQLWPSMDIFIDRKEEFQCNELKDSFIVGEICLKMTKTMSIGYLSNGKVIFHSSSSQTNTMFTKDIHGFYRTGDIGAFNKTNKSLFFLCRKRPSIILTNCRDENVKKEFFLIEEKYRLFLNECFHLIIRKNSLVVTQRKDKTTGQSTLSLHIAISVESHRKILRTNTEQIKIESSIEEILLSEFQKYFSKKNCQDGKELKECQCYLVPEFIYYYEKELPKSPGGKIIYPSLKKDKKS